MAQRLTATETAARLGVKPETLYAYVSRGLLGRERDRSGSTFDPLEVEEFAASRQRSGTHRTPVLIKDGRPSGGPLMTIESDVALIEDDALYYRGVEARTLAAELDFEEVCLGLWRRSAPAPTGTRFRPLPGAVDAVRAVLSRLPDGTLSTDRIRTAVPVLGALDPLREELQTEAVISRSEAMIATLATVLGADDGTGRDDHRIADRLAAGLAADRGPDLAECVNAALVLLVDHDLAASTLAARVAASARANPYAVVSSGLGALDSALHGNVSRAAHRMLAAVVAGEPTRDVVSGTIVAGRSGVPGFGHRLYRDRDPRAEMIFSLLEPMPAAAPVLAAAAEVSDLVADHGGSFRNVDLGLAALTLTGKMAAEAGEVIFAIARIGGWIAHALDEYSQPPLRLRPVGRYIGP